MGIPIKKAMIKADSKGRYYVCVMGTFNKKKESNSSGTKRISNNI